MDNLTFLFLGYLGIWIVIFIYTLTLHNRQQKLRQDLDLLRKTLEKDRR